MFTLLGASLGAILDTTFGLILLALCLIGVIIIIVGEVELFKKCGIPGWKAIVPFYSSYVFTVQICELHWAWFVATLLVDLSIVSTSGTTTFLRFFVKAMCYYNLGKKFHKDPVPSLIFGAIFPEIVTCYYGFGHHSYDRFVEVKKSGLF